MFTRLDYSSALEYSIIRRYINIVYYYYYNLEGRQQWTQYIHLIFISALVRTIVYLLPLYLLLLARFSIFLESQPCTPAGELALLLTATAVQTV